MKTKTFHSAVKVGFRGEAKRTPLFPIEAENIIRELKEVDSEWTYTAVPDPSHSDKVNIEVKDEDGFILGRL